jgi:hypothetical protein
VDDEELGQSQDLEHQEDETEKDHPAEDGTRDLGDDVEVDLLNTHSC